MVFENGRLGNATHVPNGSNCFATSGGDAYLHSLSEVKSVAADVCGRVGNSIRNEFKVNRTPVFARCVRLPNH